MHEEFNPVPESSHLNPEARYHLQSLLELVRLLARQAAREAFLARDEAEAS